MNWKVGTESFFEPNNVSVDDMDKFEEKKVTEKKMLPKTLGVIGTIG